MARLHSETTTSLAATARGVDGFVTTQTATDGCGNTATTVYEADFEAPSVVTHTHNSSFDTHERTR